MAITGSGVISRDAEVMALAASVVSVEALSFFITSVAFRAGFRPRFQLVGLTGRRREVPSSGRSSRPEAAADPL